MEERIDDLKAEARHARERRDLYQAKMYGSRPTTPGRMRELERELAGAEDRLHLAERRAAAATQARDEADAAGTPPR
jgi:predicted  nucleic acid-binding Zn-ribbon protein